MDIKKVWKVFKISSMKDMDMQRVFQRAVTANACIELLEENEKLETAIRETIEDNLHLADGEVCTLIKLKRAINYT
jgi:hypothetical protein